MGTVGKLAFPVILALGGVTGVLTYIWFFGAIPHLGDIQSPYRQVLPPQTQAQGQTTNSSQPVDESKFKTIVSIDILKGASVQGSPSYSPSPAKASEDALIKWTNQDTAVHTATSGKDSSDENSGKLFDSGYLNPGKSYSVPASKLGKGDHPYYCQVHPFMSSSITVD
jgi:plastocyanin